MWIAPAYVALPDEQGETPMNALDVAACGRRGWGAPNPLKRANPRTSMTACTGVPGSVGRTRLRQGGTRLHGGWGWGGVGWGAEGTRCQPHCPIAHGTTARTHTRNPTPYAQLPGQVQSSLWKGRAATSPAPPFRQCLHGDTATGEGYQLLTWIPVADTCHPYPVNRRREGTCLWIAPHAKNSDAHT
jgi:hypothetical protein